MTLPNADDLSAAAVNYVKAGMWIVPLHDLASGWCSCGRAGCSSPGKHPRTASGLSEASNDPAVVARWWALWPLANIGCVCGRSNLVVVDVDVKKGAQGEATVRWLITRPEYAEAFQATYLVGTPSGGYHYYFFGRVRTDHSTYKGVDIQSEGAYVLMPPSVAFGGYDAEKNPVAGSQTAYHVIRSATLQAYPIRDVPGYDFSQMGAKPTVDTAARSAIPIGEHRNALLRVAFTYRRVLGLSVEATRAAMEEMIASGVLEGYDPKHPFTKRDLVGMIDGLEPNAATAAPLPGAANIIEFFDDFNAVTNVTSIERQIVIPGLMLQGELHVFYGKDGSKKTTIAAYLLALISRQGRNVGVFISEDQPKDFAHKFQLAGGDTSRFFCFNSDRFKGDFLLPKYKADLEKMLQGRDWGCIYFDSINDFKSMDSRLNAADEARQMFGPLQQLAQRYNTAILCTLHTNKQGSLEGARQIRAKSRVVAFVGPPELEATEAGWDFGHMLDPDFTAQVTTEKFSRGLSKSSFHFYFQAQDADDEYEIQPDGTRTLKEHFFCAGHALIKKVGVESTGGRPRVMELDDLAITINRMVEAQPNITANAVFKAVGGNRNQVMPLVREAKERLK